ncbi:hypothetical protein GOP47_0005417 [Adiantum capillus-veneris]|uniref:Pentatricopeptide repeat-containing protein n=1 Tax=Adiantum capillus-veneris TaxID=13818 RepID=A0A9D4V680_ADICA|nr:hypothetical protein GOP47_0005417 [Adiantum capillus-veneris]
MHGAWKLNILRRLFELTSTSIAARGTKTSVRGTGSLLADGLYELFPHGHAFSVAFTTSKVINSRPLCHFESMLEPRYDHVGFIPAAKDKSIADSETGQNVYMASRQFPMIDCSIGNNSKAKILVQSSKEESNHHNETSQYLEINDNRSTVLTQQQNRLSFENFQHQSTGSDFYEEVKITDDAGEPLMPRSLLDLAVEDFMHKENKQGHLLWQSFKKAAAMRPVSTFESVLATWCGERTIASRPALIYCVLVFRSWKKNKRALKLLDWIQTEKPFEMVDIDHAIYMDLICKTEGCKKGSKYLQQIPKTLQSSMIYSALLAAYIEHDMEDSAKQLLLQARSLDVTEQTFLFNQLLLFYKGKGRITDVSRLLKEMEDLGVDANLSTYNIVLDLRARKGDLSGMQNLWNHLEKATDIKPDAASYAILAKGYMILGLFDKAERAVKQIERSPCPNKRAVYRWLLKLYGQLKREDHLERVWDMLKNISKSLVDDYSIMVESLGKAGAVNRAEELFKEGVSKLGIKRLHQYHTLISVYLNHGKIQKAESLVTELTKHAFNPGSATYHQLIELYAKSGDEKRAMETLRKAQDASKVFSWQKPWYASYLTMLEMFGKKGDVEHAELIVKELKDTGYPCTFKMYSALLKAYVKAKVMPKGFLDRMRANGTVPNSSIREDLEKIMDNRRELYEVYGAKRYLH